ncbi:hypothetical protein S83_050302, partial [Arachis hypogaea]
NQNQLPVTPNRLHEVAAPSPVGNSSSLRHFSVASLLCFVSIIAAVPGLRDKKCVPCNLKELRPMTEDAAHTLMPQDMESKLKTFTKGLEFFKIEADLAESEVIGREWKKIFGEQFSLTIIRLRCIVLSSISLWLWSFFW